MRALFTSRNLIGDGIQISAALRKWHEEHPEYTIDLLTNNDHVAPLYEDMGVPLHVIFDREIKEKQQLDGRDVTVTYTVEYDYEFVFDINKAFQLCDQFQCPMATGYAKLLGVDVGGDIGPFYDPPILEEDNDWVASVPKDTILVAPFSNSCTSHEGKPPNKTLPWPKWRPILRYLRSLNRPIRITGSKSERADQIGISEDEYLTGIPLRPLARAMKEGRISLVVSVDNGISHLTGSQKLNHILYYPLCLGMHYAVPWGNPHVVPIHIDPAVVEPAQLLWATKQSVKQLEEAHVPQTEN